MEIKVATESWRKTCQANLVHLKQGQFSSWSQQNLTHSKDPVHQDGKIIKEVINIFQDRDPIYQLHKLQLWMNTNCSKTENEKKLWPKMCWVLTGLCKDKWKEKVSRIKNFETRTSSNQCKKFKRLIQEFNKEYFANNTLKIQKKELHNDELCYERHDHCEIIMGLFIINEVETSFLQKPQVSQSQRGQRKSY